MSRVKLEYQNQWCKIVSNGEYYILKSLTGKYNDQYFITLDLALRAIGLTVATYKRVLHGNR